MSPIWFFIFIIFYLLVTYTLVILKYNFYFRFNFIGRGVLIGLQSFFTVSNVFLYLVFIAQVFNYHLQEITDWILVGVGAVIFLAGLIIYLDASRHLGAKTFIPHEQDELMMVGPYSIIRHPMYLGVMLIFLGLAVAVAAQSLLGIIYTVISALVLYFVSVSEEIEMDSRFGEKFQNYKKIVARFNPFWKKPQPKIDYNRIFRSMRVPRREEK